MKLTLALAALLATTLASPAPAQNIQATLPAPTAVQDKTQPSPRLNPVQARAARLSDRMVRDLRLNGYQAARLRAINEEKITRLEANQRQHAADAKLLQQQNALVYKERDRELSAVLSTDQYSDYFDARKRYNKLDEDFAAASASENPTNPTAAATSATQAAFIKSVQNPTPVRTNNATIGPAKAAPIRPAGNLGRNARRSK